MNELVSSDFLRVLKALKENIMRDLNVAKICKVTRIDNNNFFCESIADGTVVNARVLQGLTINISDIVLILFCDNDFRANLDLSSYTTIFKKTNNTEKHSNAFGVIIGKI